MDVEAWLAGVGLAQYAQTFRDNAIDAEVLPDLTDAHLRELGLPLGARLKIVKAVAALRARGPSPAAAPIPQTTPRAGAERRQLTVMFCDLVGSTALSARLDPEDMREVVGAYHRCCQDLITKAGGFVAKYMGDGVSPILAILRLTNMTPSAPCRLGFGSSRRRQSSRRSPAFPCTCAWASPPGSSW